MQNPFQYGKVVEAPFFTDRESVLHSMMDDLESGNNLVLYSPRRYGKTSLLNKVAQEMSLKGFKTIYIDFYRVTSIKKLYPDIYPGYRCQSQKAYDKFTQEIQQYGAWDNHHFEL
jgi:AAA+ ATPase superfamily predicted ATPase